MHTAEYYSAIKKEWRSGTCYNVDEPWWYYTEWEKPYVLYVCIYVNMQNKQIYRDRKEIDGFQGLEGERNGEHLHHGCFAGVTKMFWN